MELVLATNNPHKVREIGQSLAEVRLKTLAEVGIAEELPETSPTLQGNAEQKARYVYDRLGVACLADDTGLEVAALGGEPGVYSARYAGSQKDPAANTEKLLAALAGTADRSAQFRTVFCLIDPSGQAHFFEGVARGRITEQPAGAQGFGYDPVFQPEGHDITFAEMDLDTKNSISHRGKAVAALQAYFAQP